MDLVLASADVHDPPMPVENINGYDEPNPLDPQWDIDMRAAAQKRGELVIQHLLRHAVRVISLPEGDFAKRTAKRHFGEDAEYAALFLWGLDGVVDYSLVAYDACLTERRVERCFRALRITKSSYGVPEAIDQAPLKHVVNPGISSGTIKIGDEQLVSLTEEYDAAIAAGLNWLDWCNGGYALDFMAMTLALTRANNLKSLHTSDAVQEAAREAAKKGNKQT